MSYRIRRRHIVASLTLFILLAVLCGIGVFRHTGKQQLDQRLADLRDQGYPTTLDDLEALHRIPEGADNAAPLYLQAIAMYFGSTLDLPTLNKQLPLKVEALHPSDEQLIQELLTDHEDVLILLHAAAEIEHCEYPPDPESRFSVIFKHLIDVQKLVLLLSVQAHWSADQNEPTAAYESLRASVALTQSLDAPLLINHLAMNQREMDVIRGMQRVLNRIAFTEPQLVSLSKSILPWMKSDGLAQPMAAERCFTLIPLQQKITGSFVLSLRSWLGLLPRDIVKYIDLAQKGIEIANLPSHLQLGEAQTLATASQNHSNPLLNRVGTHGSGFIQRNLVTVTHARLAVTALAIERYKLAHGNLPTTLDVLSPQYMPSIPLDPFDGLPLKYEKRSNGFTVYSVGPDQAKEISFVIGRI